MTTTNQQLIKLMSDNGLTAITVSKLLEVSESSVNSWRQAPGTEGARNMPAVKLKYLEILIKSKVFHADNK